MIKHRGGVVQIVGQQVINFILAQPDIIEITAHADRDFAPGIVIREPPPALIARQLGAHCAHVERVAHTAPMRWYWWLAVIWIGGPMIIIPAWYLMRRVLPIPDAERIASDEGELRA